MLRVSIWIDGVLYDDGSFYGLDEFRSLSRLEAAVDLYREIFKLLREKSEGEALEALQELGRLRIPDGTPFEASHGQTKALMQAVFEVKTGHVARFLDRQAGIVAAIPEIHRGTKK